jgi:EAL domain-containing protein (putative c-di-GMP-specific phosphodiesterase class I)
MAKELNMKIVAEFVSSKELQKAVIEMGIEHSQGYYLGEPKPYLIDESIDL